jgi:hypothetical protein
VKSIQTKENRAIVSHIPHIDSIQCHSLHKQVDDGIESEVVAKDDHPTIHANFDERKHQSTMDSNIQIEHPQADLNADHRVQK